MKLIKQFGEILIIVLLLLVTFTACKKDKTDKENTFSYDGTNYKLSTGYLIYYGENDTESSDIDIMLLSPTVEEDIVNGGFTGVGEGVYLDLNSPSLTELAAGTYNWDLDRNPNTLVYGEIYVSYNFATDDGDYYEVTDGSVTINISGTTYDIAYDLVLANSKTVTGNYKGNLTEVNATLKKTTKWRPKH